MAKTITLKDGKVEVILSQRDFVYLIEEYMGHDAAEHFQELVDELEEDEIYD